MIITYLYNAPICHLRWFFCIFASISLRAIQREAVYSQEGPEYLSVNTFDTIFCISIPYLWRRKLFCRLYPQLRGERGPADLGFEDPQGVRQIFFRPRLHLIQFVHCR
jgi:hypothetical protein